MANVPELYDFPMDSYSEEEFYTDCSSEMKVSMDYLGWKVSTPSRCRSGIAWNIRKPRKAVPSFKKAIKLIVIIGKVTRGKRFAEISMFDDHDLLNHFFVEEKTDITNVEERFMSRPKFTYNHTLVFNIRDNMQKYLMLQRSAEDYQLVASFLQGRDAKKPEINMDVFRASRFNQAKLAVALGIKDFENHKHYFSCKAEQGNQDTPVLSIMKDVNITEKKDNDLLPFLFYKSGNSLSNNTFESVAFPTWFICTSQIEGQPVQMKDQSDQLHIRNFQLYNA